MGMVGLAGRLPELTEGTNKWITALEESTAGVSLALGDIKALLMNLAGKNITEEIFTAAGLGMVVRGNSSDHVGFGGHRTALWAQMQIQYTEKMDPSKLEGERLGNDECPLKFLHAFQHKWEEETGSPWNVNNTTQSLFKLMVKKSMSPEVMGRLDNVVELMRMPWEQFQEHIVHHVEQHRKEKRNQEEQNKQLTNKLIQLQVGELSRNKKDKGKAQAPVQVQAPVVTSAAPQQPPIAAAVAPHLPEAPVHNPQAPHQNNPWPWLLI